MYCMAMVNGDGFYIVSNDNRRPGACAHITFHLLYYVLSYSFIFFFNLIFKLNFLFSST